MSQIPRPPRRQLDGVLLLDKPLGLSSNDALLRAKRLLLAKKAGHTGTLDPLATGLLPLCFGEATKFSQDLLDAAKTYEATVHLGVRTTTGDAEGEAVATRPVTCDEAAVHAILADFRGALLQIPPMYSALKRDGKPLYEYARAGQAVERAARPVTIHRLELLACALPASPEFKLRIMCSKGTYIRTLAEDIGEALGCGAHLVALRRTGVGALTLAQAVTLEDLSSAGEEARSAWLQPVDTLLSSFPAARLDALLAQRFRHGQRLRLPDGFAFDPRAASEPAAAHGMGQEPEQDQPLPPSAGLRVSVYDNTGRLLGTARVKDGVLAPERLIALVGAAQE